MKLSVIHEDSHVHVGRSWMMSKSGKNKKWLTTGPTECVTDVLTTFLCPL